MGPLQVKILIFFYVIPLIGIICPINGVLLTDGIFRKGNYGSDERTFSPINRLEAVKPIQFSLCGIPTNLIFARRDKSILLVVTQPGFRKVYARWVPRLLTNGHHTQRLAAALTFLTNCRNDLSILTLLLPATRCGHIT